MECKPFNIDVVLVSPGGVKSNIATNQASSLALPADSLYSDYAEAIIKRMNRSQIDSPMPTAVFAQRVTTAVLQRRPPRYMTLGRMSSWYRFFQWLPRGWILSYMWKVQSKVTPKAT